ncbi:MAG: M23 family metallopeptidase [Rhodospirillales bacterium]|nr:M23 family metallopeptidase [Rhodospirillales bacterium]
MRNQRILILIAALLAIVLLALLAFFLLSEKAVETQPTAPTPSPPPAETSRPPQLLELGLPIDCAPGDSCWIVSYVDHDPSSGIRDYMCGAATYNGADGKGHNGTDFAIRDRAAMRDGVPVLSAAPGVIAGLRDGMDDTPITSADGAKSLDGKYCGNGVRIDHGNGWSTQYCHLKKGSLTVKAKQRVDGGDVLGLVGLSGLTQYPHLHITVRLDEKVIDPFVGTAESTRCGLGAPPLWSTHLLGKLEYHPTAIFNAGFAREKADPKRARNGDYSVGELAGNSPALVLWADIFNVRKGDKIVHRITAPDGSTLVEHRTAIEKNQARRFIFVGKPRRVPRWISGNYVGEVRLIRESASDETNLRETRIVSIR